MRPVYVVSGGVSKFSKARPDKTFQAVVKEAYDYILADLGLEHPRFIELVDGSVASYFSDHFTRQLMAGIMVQDYLGLCPKPGHRVEGGGATGVHVVACLPARRDDRVVDVVTRDLGPSQGFTDGERCDVIDLHIFERSTESPHGRPHGAHEHYITQLAHSCLLIRNVPHSPLALKPPRR